MDRRRSLLAASMQSGGISVTIENHLCYPEVVDYLENKYGFSFGTRTSPISIEEDIWLGESFAGDVGFGQVKYLYIDDTPNSVGILLYLSNYRDTYYCISINNDRNHEFFGLARPFMWD